MKDRERMEVGIWMRVAAIDLVAGPTMDNTDDSFAAKGMNEHTRATVTPTVKAANTLEETRWGFVAGIAYILGNQGDDRKRIEER
mmetsp:Transcript_5707/g.7952  ORF Transcript_5707/g.7952 Transcript_5707/m.7952 type:complete len:85 (+) Transcript_5707:2026-2280(+)